MPDETKSEETVIPVRVFDSVTAAVENSLPPAAPPYADLTASNAVPVPVDQKPSGRRTQRRTTGVTVHAGAAAPGVQAKDAKTKAPEPVKSAE